MSLPTSTTRSVASPSLPRLPCTSATTWAARSSRSPIVVCAFWMSFIPSCSWCVTSVLTPFNSDATLCWSPLRSRRNRSARSLTSRRTASWPSRPSARTVSIWRRSSSVTASAGAVTRRRSPNSRRVLARSQSTMPRRASPMTATTSSMSIALLRQSFPPPVAAHALEAARGADLRVPAIEAVARHPLVAEREVELHRVGRVDRREPSRDLLRHAPGARASAREADRAADVLDVGVDRHQQARRRHGCPQAEVGRLPPDHPAQVEVQALARAAERGQRKEMAIAARDASAREDLSQVGLEERAGESLEGRADRPGGVGITREEALLEGAEAGEEVAGGDAEGHQVPRAAEAIPEDVEGDRVPAGGVRGHERRG